MIKQKEKDVFLDYIKDYIVFLDEMIEIQKRQLNAVVGTSIKDKDKIREVDKTVVEVQGYTKRMDIMEQKRLEIQQDVGLGNMTFGQIIDSIDGSKKQEYTITLEQFKKCIENVVFYSQKVQEKVQSDLNVFNRVINQPSSYNANRQQLEVNRFGGSFQVKT